MILTQRLRLLQFKAMNTAKNNYTLIGKLVETSKGVVKVDVAIAAQPPQGYVVETRYMGVNEKTGELYELQPYQLVRIKK